MNIKNTQATPELLEQVKDCDKRAIYHFVIECIKEGFNPSPWLNCVEGRVHRKLRFKN
jgi:hypothetical protein